MVALEAGTLGPGTRALILAPTRELAVQIEDAIQGLLYHTAITSAVVYGGVPMEPQDRALRAGAHIIVATPGRLMDHMRSQTPDFSPLEVLVLDEADRMMDMGFWPDVQRIVVAAAAGEADAALLGNDARRRAEAGGGAGEDAEVHRDWPLGRARSHDHAHRRDGRVQGQAAVARAVPQAGRRADAGVHPHQARRRSAGASAASALGVRAVALHGDRSQEQRTAAVEGFRSGRHRVLVATDIAARGLDIEGITHVINFEVPSSPEAYVHRVGRTGRDLTAGTALTLAAPEEQRALRALEKSVGVQLE